MVFVPQEGGYSDQEDVMVVGGLSFVIFAPKFGQARARVLRSQKFDDRVADRP